MPALYDPTAPRKKFALARWIREYNDKHPKARVTYAPGFDPKTDKIGTPARETLKKVQRLLNLPVSGNFDRETMRRLLPPGIRAEVMAVAHSQLGIHEWPAGSNSGPVRKYLEAAGYPWAGPWCASFVEWCLLQCGVTAHPSNPAWVPAWHEYARQHGLLKDVADSKLGDLWIWWRDQHIGFCDDTDPDNFVAYGLDGNVGEYGGSVTHVARTRGEVTAVIDLVKLAALK